jgi:hypothetical protein
MSSNLFSPSLRYTNKDSCNSAWTFIDGQNVSDIEVPQFIKNLFTSFDDSRYGKMGKDLIEGVGVGETCSTDTNCTDPNNLCKLSSDSTQACPSDDQSHECACVLVDPESGTGGDGGGGNTPCNPDSCNGHGACSPNAAGSSYTCVCSDGYTGTDCETPPSDPCNPDPCNGHGACSPNADSSSYTCVCSDGYTGTDCETPPSDPCNPDSCNGHGACSPNADSSSYTCVCSDGYTGTDCETEPPDNTCETAFGGAPTDSSKHPCNVNSPEWEGGGWTINQIEADPPWYEPNGGGNIDPETVDAFQNAIQYNADDSNKNNPPNNTGISQNTWSQCCTTKAECGTEWNGVTISGSESWAAYGSSWGCILPSLDP